MALCRGEVVLIHGLTHSSTVEVVSFFYLTSEAPCTFSKIKMLHNVQNMLLEPLDCYKLSDFSTTWGDGVRLNGFRFVDSSSGNIQEAKEMYCVGPDSQVQRS